MSLIDDDYSALGNNYLAGIGVNLLDGQDGTTLNVGTQRTNRTINVGSGSNTGVLALAGGSGGVTVTASGTVAASSTGTGHATLKATGTGNVELIAAAGSTTIDAGTTSNVIIGATAAGVTLGKAGGLTRAAGELEVTDGILYFGDSTTDGIVRMRWDGTGGVLYLERLISGVWTDRSYWTL